MTAITGGVTTLDLIHYGSNKFKPEEFSRPTGESKCIGLKPIGGLWASPSNSEYGWRHWCAENNYGDLSVFFSFRFAGCLLVIDSVDDMDKIPWTERNGLQSILFKEIIKIYDGIWLTARGERETRLTWPRSLYGWDCESVVIFNKDCIETY